MLEGSGVGVSPAGTSAVSKHEIKSVTQHQGACSRGGSGGGFPPRHGCCVQARDRYCDYKQKNGALHFMVACALRGGGGLLHLREHISLRCALGGGKCVAEPGHL